MKKQLVLAGLLALVNLSSQAQRHKSQPMQKAAGLTQYVDPYIGTGFHGHVFVGASVPFGAVQLGPTNISEGWDWCSGYHISDSTIIGFQHTHLSGTGIGDLGDISFDHPLGTDLAGDDGPNRADERRLCRDADKP